MSDDHSKIDPDELDDLAYVEAVNAATAAFIDALWNYYRPVDETEKIQSLRIARERESRLRQLITARLADLSYEYEKRGWAESTVGQLHADPWDDDGTIDWLEDRGQFWRVGFQELIFDALMAEPADYRKAVRELADAQTALSSIVRSLRLSRETTPAPAGPETTADDASSPTESNGDEHDPANNVGAKVKPSKPVNVNPAPTVSATDDGEAARELGYLGIVIDESQLAFTRDGRTLALAGKPMLFRVLQKLIGSRGRFVSKRDIATLSNSNMQDFESARKPIGELRKLIKPLGLEIKVKPNAGWTLTDASN